MRHLTGLPRCAAILLLLGTGASFAQVSPLRWEADRFVTIEGSLQSYEFSPTEVASARKRVAQFVADRSELFHALHAETVRSLPAGQREFSAVRAMIDRTFADADLEFAEIDRLTEQLPDQAVVVMTIQGHAAIEGAALLARSLREPGAAPLLFPTAPRFEPLIESMHPACGVVQNSEQVCDYQSPLGCKFKDFATCLKVSEGILGFFITADAATPNDIMLIVFGSGVNIPSPFKVAVNVLLYLAKVGGQIGECFLDGASECSYAQALNFLQDENRWASDFELADSKQQIQAAIGAGSSRVGSTLQSLGGLTGSSLDRLAREEDYASDSEFFSSMATLQSQIAELSDLSCHVEQLARLPHSERSTVPPRCDPTGASGSKRTAKRSSTGSKHERIREPQPRTLQTLQLELALVGATPLATNPATVSQLDEVKRLVWDTIRAQRRLAISPAATSASEKTARDADRLLLAGQIQRSFEVYQQAYRTLVTGN